MINNLFSLVSRMSGIQRFSMLKMCHAENVLEHTGMVCIFCYVITDRLNANHHGVDHIDMGEVLRRACVHDWDETISGDVVRPTKNFSPELRLEMAKLENAGIENLQRKLKLPSLVMDHAIAKESKPGSIVALADIMAACHRTWEEAIVFNNHHFIEPAHGMRGVLQKVAAKLQHQDFTVEQHRLLEDIVRELNLKLNKILEHPNELVELHSAD